MFAAKLRVTGAEPGRVEFELDIKKEHTVSSATHFVLPWKKRVIFDLVRD